MLFMVHGRRRRRRWEMRLGREALVTRRMSLANHGAIEFHPISRSCPATRCVDRDQAIISGCRNLRPFPPGHYYSSKTGEFTLWYNPIWRTLTNVR